METKHTKGEWYKMKADLFGVPYIIASGNETIFQCYGEESQANAKLIAAAPEMLYALKEVQDYLLAIQPEWMEGEEILYSKIELAIKKATE